MNFYIVRIFLSNKSMKTYRLFHQTKRMAELTTKRKFEMETKGILFMPEIKKIAVKEIKIRQGVFV